MNLLLSNDDGVFSAGMHALVAELRAQHSVTVVAPESQRSGAGHGITCVQPVRVREVTLQDFPDVPAFAVDGTPADCVRLGCTSLGLNIDMVIAGINHGANLGSDVLYSGTVGAAMEGALLGKPAIAASCYNHRAVDFSAAARATLWAIDHIEKNPLPPGMMLNLNAPELPIHEIKGVKLAGLCLQTYGGDHAAYEDPHGMRFFWMPLESKTTPCGDGMDESYVREGYVTLTPIHYDIACYTYMKQMDVSDFDLNVIKEKI